MGLTVKSTKVAADRNGEIAPGARGAADPRERAGRIARPIAAGELQGRKIVAGSERGSNDMTSGKWNIAFQRALQPSSCTPRSKTDGELR